MDRFIDFFRYKTIEEWAAIATIGSFFIAIVALMIALFTWVFPDPVAKMNPSAPTAQVQAERSSELNSPAAKTVEAEAPLYEIVKSEQY